MAQGMIVMENRRIHLMLPHTNPALPLAVDSIGYNPQQETIKRKDGFPCFHWLHTLSGVGEFTVHGQAFTMTENSGVLLAPHVAHAYQAKTDSWSTCYITFYGAQALPMLETLGVGQVCHIRWGDYSEIGDFFEKMLNAVQQGMDFTGLESSGDLYRLLLLLPRWELVPTPT
jgi:quercetin dioxygenase-like cupin family protein